MNIITCNIPVQLVGNNNRLILGQGRFIASAKYRECKEALLILFKSNSDIRDIKKCEVHIYLSSKQWEGDIDNVSKVILDALQLSGIIQNDRHIYKLTIEKIDGTISYLELRY